MDFLHHRARVIDEFLLDGKSCEEVATLLSMDAEQVRLISMRNQWPMKT